MKTSVRVEKKITVRIERNELEKLIRQSVNAPVGASFDFDGSYLDHVDVMWSEYADEDKADG